MPRFTPLQLLGLRWVLLQAVHAGGTLRVTDRMCLDVAAAAYTSADLERTRIELDYLETAGLVELERSEARPWSARLTHRGRDVVDYVVPAPDGIARPPLAAQGM